MPSCHGVMYLFSVGRVFYILYDIWINFLSYLSSSESRTCRSSLSLAYLVMLSVVLQLLYLWFLSLLSLSRVFSILFPWSIPFTSIFVRYIVKSLCFRLLNTFKGFMFFFLQLLLILYFIDMTYFNDLQVVQHPSWLSYLLLV